MARSLSPIIIGAHLLLEYHMVIRVAWLGISTLSFPSSPTSDWERLNSQAMWHQRSGHGLFRSSIEL